MDLTAPAIMREALALRSSHPDVPALEVFDLIMEGRRGGEIELPDFDETPQSQRFASLLVDAFVPYSDEERRILAGEDDRYDDISDIREAEELRPSIAARRFTRRYELNGCHGREVWAQTFAATTVDIDPSTTHANAYALGLKLWEQDDWWGASASVAARAVNGARR